MATNALNDWAFSIADRYLMSDGNVYHVDGRYDVGDFYLLLDLGIFTEDDRVELIDGRMIAMERVSPPVANCVMRLNRPLLVQTVDSVMVSIHNPLRLNRWNEMLPDVAVIHENWNIDEHPRPWDTELVIEVRDSSWSYDHDVKLPLYAEAKIPEVWLIDVNRRALHRYRETDGHRFTRVDCCGSSDQITFDRIPGCPVTIDLASIFHS